MGFVYTVLGAGRQGVAMAHDLARNGEAEHVVLARSFARDSTSIDVFVVALEAIA